MLELFSKLPLASLLFGAGTSPRRCYVHEGRAHVEHRAKTPEDVAALKKALVGLRGQYFHVEWVEINAQLGRVVVAYARGAYSVRELCDFVARAEEDAGLAEKVLPERTAHPVDDGQRARMVTEMSAEAAGLALGAMLRLSPLPPSALASNLSAAVTVVGAVGRFRRVIEESLGEVMTEHVLHIADPIAMGLAQRTLGPFVDLVHGGALWFEQRAREKAFEARAHELFAKPFGDVPPAPPPSRVSLPKGPIERYEGNAWAVSLGAFFVSLAASRSAESALASMLVGLPKSARLGREGFATHLGWVLAHRGAFCLDPQALRRLDRVDTVVLPVELFGEVDPTQGPPVWLETLLTAAREAELTVHLASTDPRAWAGLGADGVLLGGDALGDSVRRLQTEGKVVLLANRGRTKALAIADVGVGLMKAGGDPPWGAHVVVRDDFAELCFLFGACKAAKTTSSESVSLALAAAGIGSFATAKGLLSNARRVMRVVNLASLVSMANGLRLSLELAERPVVAPRDPTPWHQLGVDDALSRLGVTDKGLRDRDVLARHRPMRAPPAPIVELGRAVAKEAMNPLTPLLAAGAGLSAVVGSMDDAMLVASVVGLNALVGGVQRWSSERAVRALERQARVFARVRRNGELRTVPQSELVRGDVIVLEAGDVVPADCRLVTAENLEVDAASLTGESMPVVKAVAPSKAAQIAERASMLYEGTTIASGRATAVVVAVGIDTEVKRAAVAAGAQPTRGGVEARLEKLTSLTAPFAATAGLSLVGLGLLRGRSVDEVVGAGVSMAVAAVPEGLPLLATAAQLAAAKRLAEHGALVRDPKALEALGRVSVMCVDKTGTMTEGRLRLAVVSDGVSDEELGGLGSSSRLVVAAALRASSPPHPTASIDAVDEAIGGAAKRTQVAAEDGAPGFRPLAELPFAAVRRLAAVLGQTTSGACLSVKGAPESVLPLVTTDRAGVRLDAVAKARIEEHVKTLASRGLRVLAIAERHTEGHVAVTKQELSDADVVELGFVGLVAFRDPVRKEAPGLIRDLAKAGVRVVMITGDHARTAQAIAGELGLDGDTVSGAELDDWTEEQLDARASGIAVVARATPSQKVRLVRAFQRLGATVAMAGDGANDAPAIRLADVGVALGERATAAARASADLVLMDERIGTLVRAVAEGRALWSAVRDSVSILIGGNLGEIGFTLGAGLIDGRPPLNARQLLLVNLLTDVAPAMAIAIRPPPEEVLEKLAGQGPDASLGRGLYRDIALRAALTASGAGGAWFAARITGTSTRARTVGMVALVGSQLGQTLVAGGRDMPVWLTCLGSAAVLTAIVQTPGLSQTFGCTPLGPVGWATAVGASAVATGAAYLMPKAKDIAWRPG